MVGKGRERERGTRGLGGGRERMKGLQVQVSPLEHGFGFLSIDKKTLHHWHKHFTNVSEDHHLRLSKRRLDVVEVKNFVVRNKANLNRGTTLLMSTAVLARREQLLIIITVCILDDNIIQDRNFQNLSGGRHMPGAAASYTCTCS